MNLIWALIQTSLQFIGLSADPSSPPNGMIWYNSTLGKFRVREDGVTKNADTTGGGGLPSLGNIHIISLGAI